MTIISSKSATSDGPLTTRWNVIRKAFSMKEKDRPTAAPWNTWLPRWSTRRATITTSILGLSEFCCLNWCMAKLPSRANAIKSWTGTERWRFHSDLTWLRTTRTWSRGYSPMTQRIVWPWLKFFATLGWKCTNKSHSPIGQVKTATAILIWIRMRPILRTKTETKKAKRRKRSTMMKSMGPSSQRQVVTQPTQKTSTTSMDQWRQAAIMYLNIPRRRRRSGAKNSTLFKTKTCLVQSRRNLLAYIDPLQGTLMDILITPLLSTSETMKVRITPSRLVRSLASSDQQSWATSVTFQMCQPKST